MEGKDPNAMNQKLYDDLQKMTNLREQYEKKVNDYSDLEKWIDTAKKQKLVKTQVEIGTGIYMKAKVDPNEKIMLDIGLGFFLEVTLDEAKPLIEKRKKLYEGKLNKLLEEIAKVRVNITRFESLLENFMAGNSFY